MTELVLGLKGTAGLLIACLYSLFCWFGGRDIAYLNIPQRIWGRVIAPLSFVSALIGLSWVSQSFRPQYLIAYLLYFASHTLGYGGRDWITKITRRSLWSFGRTFAAVPFVTSADDITLLTLQIILGLVATLALGLFNPIKAPQEEGLINFSNVFIIPFMVLN